MSTTKAKSTKSVKAAKSTKSAKAATKPTRAIQATKSVKGGSKSAAPKARAISNVQVETAPPPIDTRKTLGDIIKEQQIARGLENATAFEVKTNSGETFVVASHLSPRMNELYDPAEVQVTPKQTARAGATAGVR